VALVGLGLRLAWVVYAAHTPHGPYDPARYLTYAQQFARGHGYVSILLGPGTVIGKPTSYYPPGYPVFLGTVAAVVRYTFLPDNVPLVAGVVQAVLGASMAVSVAVIGRRLWTPLAGVVGAAVVACYPNLVFYSAALLSETLYMALFLAALAVLLGGAPARAPGELGGEGSRARVAVFAVLFALAVMVRPIILPLLVPLAVLWWLRNRDLRRVLQLVGITVGVLVVVIGGWTVRNAVRMHAFVPLSTNSGDNLCIAYAPHANGAFSAVSDCATPSWSDSALGGPAGEVRHDNILRHRAWHYATGNLNRVPWLLWRRVDVTYSNDHDALIAVQSYLSDRWMPVGTYNALVKVADISYVIVALVGLAGLVILMAARRGPPFARWVFLWSVIVTAGVPLVFFGDPRFKVPVMPLLAVTAGVAVSAAVERLRRPTPPAEPPVLEPTRGTASAGAHATQ
jgi:hypothetical protein